MLHDSIPSVCKGQSRDLLKVATRLNELAHPKGWTLEVVSLSFPPRFADLHFRRFIKLPIILFSTQHQPEKLPSLSYFSLSEITIPKILVLTINIDL